jgi:hypothetical protein
MFWNLSWSVIEDPADGTFYFNNEPNLLDQILGLGPDGRVLPGHVLVHDTLQILRFPGTFTGRYKRPRPFGGMGSAVDEDGYFDHFPIGLRVTEAD